MKKLLRDRQAVRAGVLVALLFPMVYFAISLLGWGNDTFNWWQAVLVGLFTGALFWFFTSSFRRFRDEDVTQL